jgi:6-methylsalicylate decarboxylase
MRTTATPHRLAECACCATPRFSADGGVDRRSFLAGGVAVGVGAIGALRPSPAPAQAASAKRIDVHHHFLAPFHREVLQVNRGSAPLPNWTIEGSLQDMEKAGVATAMLSVISPACGSATWSRAAASRGAATTSPRSS